MVRNYGLSNPSGTLNGADGRPIYLPSDRAVNEFGGATNAYVFTNTNVGYSFNWSFKLQKNFKNGLFVSAAYTASRYGDKHRIVGQINKSFSYGKNKQWRTSLGAFYEYAQGGRFSYTYSGDINNDGSVLNDLIYIPTESELATYNFSGTVAEQAEQRAALGAYIQQDEYLRGRRGNYAEKYAILSPWRGRWDVKLLQDYDFQIGGKTNTIQLSVDVLNLGNLLNSDWGVIEIPVNDQHFAN